MSSKMFYMDYNYLFDSTVTVTANSSDSSFPVSNLQNFERSKVWRSTGVTSEYILIDLKTTEAIDSFALVFDAVAGMKFSEAAVVKIQGNAVNSWSSPAVSVTVTPDETYGLYTYFWSSDQSYRYWRVSLADASNGYGYLEIAKVILTKATQITALPKLGFTHGLVDNSVRSRNDYGVEYANLYPSQRMFSVELTGVAESDKQTIWGIANRLGTNTPMAICLDPLEGLFNNKDEHFLYCYMDADWESQNMISTVSSLNLSFREAI